MYFQKKSKVAVLLVFLLLVAGLLLFTGSSGGITGATITLAEESSDLLIQPIVGSEPEEIADEELGMQPIREEEQTAESEASSVEVAPRETEEPILVPQAEKISTQAMISPLDSSTISACQDLVNGDYRLDQSISDGTGTCFNIINNSITLDCDGFTITYSVDADGTAINNTGGFDHTIIRDCIIQETIGGTNTPAITFRGVANGTIENNRIISLGTAGHGIILESSFNNTIRYNNISTGVGTGAGIIINGSTPVPVGNLLLNNNISSRTSIRHLGEGINSLIYNNSFGQINWTKTNLTNDVNLSVNYNIHIANNVTGFANLPSSTTSSQAFNLNASARIEIRLLTFPKKPGLFKSGIRCDNSTDPTFSCNFTYDSTLGIAYANVTSFSNYSIVFLNAKPAVDTLVLNTTDISRNDTNVNLTAYTTTSDTDGESVKVIYNWLRNATPIAVLNMPFEGINGTTYNNSWDYSGLGNNGNETNGVVWNSTGGYDGKGAYQFGGTGTSQDIDLGDRDYFKSSLCINGCTFSAWAYKRDDTSSVVILSRNDATGNDRMFRIGVNQNEVVDFTIISNGSVVSAENCAANSATGQFLINVWHHVTGRYNLTHTALFINGTQVGATACPFPGINVSKWDESEKTFIGAREDNIPTQFWNGTIDEVTIFNRSLSAEQIYALWRNQTNVIVAQETTRGENWTVQATPNDGYEDGTMMTSTNITILDKTPPNVTLNFLNNPVDNSNFSIRSNNQTFNASIFDAESQVDTVYFWFDNGTSADINITGINNSGQWTVSYNVSTLAEEKQGVRIIANDTVNNINNSAVINFTVDFTSPNVTINSLNTNNLYNGSNYSVRSGNITFNASVFDVLTGVSTVYFWLDNGTGNDINITGVNNSGRWTISYNVSTLAEGRQGVRIIANDTVNNINDTYFMNFTIDFTPPNVTRNFLNNPVDNSNFSIRSSNQTFNASIFDNLLLVDTVYFWFDNGTSNDFNITGTNISGQWSVSYNVSTLAEGKQGVRIIANDTVNNINDTYFINFTVDFTAPTVNITTPAAGATLVGTLAFNATITDALLEISTVLFQFSNGTAPFNRTASNTSGSWNVSINTDSIVEGGLTITVFANDTVGNMNSTKTVSATVDNVAEPGSGGGADSPSSESTSSSTPTSTPSADTSTAPSAPSSSQTASAAEASSAFQSGQSSVSISRVGEKAVTSYTSEKNYKIKIVNGLNKKLVLSAALEAKADQIKLEFEENAKKRLQEELLLEGELDQAALEEELRKLKLFENVEILQAHKKISHFFPEFLVGKAITPPLIPSRERINGNLLKDLLLNAQELENIVVNPGETVEKDIRIRKGLSLDRKEPPKIIFSSAGEPVLIKDIENHDELVTGTAVDVDQKTGKLDYYMIFAPRQNGGKETFTVEMSINTKNTKLISQLPLKIKLPFFFAGNSENKYNEILGPYTVNLEKGALIAAQYDTDLPSEYEVVTKIFNKEGVVVAENKVEIKQ